MDATRDFDAIVIGGGVVGLTAALLIARRAPDARVALVAPEAPQASSGDLRTAALFPDGAALLREAGAWEAVAEHAAPLAGIRIIDQSDRLLRAPPVTFLAREVGLDAFGHNAANGAMVQALEAVAARTQALARVAATVEDTGMAEGWRNLKLADGRVLRGRVVLAADGRGSRLRAAAGIAVRKWDRDQVAVTTHFSHVRDHQGISTELHDREGPCTTVPLGARRSSLVWMRDVASADAMLTGSTADAAGQTFVRALQDRVGGFLGAVSDVRPPKTVLLSSLVAEKLAADRLMLIGESGHAFPPIGAQGLNLGMRDVAAAVDRVVAALRRGEDPGGAAVTRGYHRARWADVQARSAGVDALNQSLIAAGPLLPLARGAGMHLVKALPFAKRALMRQGMRGIELPRRPTGPRRSLTSR
ncbi:MAG: FAD-dependent monooxygenase [Pseudomonadota bacterium]